MITVLYLKTAQGDERPNNLFQVSSEFEEEFESITGYGVDASEANGLRMHPVALDIFTRKGAEWCGPGLATIQIPEILDGYWKIVAFKDGERLYYDYNKLIFDKIATLNFIHDGLAQLPTFIAEIKPIMKLFPNTISIKNNNTNRIEIDDIYSSDYEIREDHYLQGFLR